MHCPYHKEPKSGFQMALCLLLVFCCCSFICLFVVCFCVWFEKPCCNKLEPFIAAVLREGVDDGRAPLTRGFEEAAVTLYPVNSEYIVLERGC